MAGNQPQWAHETRLEATPISASEARNFVCQHLVDHRLLYLVDSVRLVASELATNALVHAQTAFTVTLSELDETVMLAVRDDSNSVPVRGAYHEMHSDGRGLKIVAMFSLDWGVVVDDGSKTVWASFAMRARN
jgi:anti-sigma regulatory factor (Ser/Thr protein kinase)